MRKLKVVSIQLVVAIMASYIFAACSVNSDLPQPDNIVPENFSVDIPSSISNQDAVSNGRMNGRIAIDTLNGNLIYLHLNTFIAVGHSASRMVQRIIKGLRQFDIQRPFTLTYESDDDHRAKKVVVEEQVLFEGELWEYMLTVYDVDSETDTDRGIAMQLFWNRNPIKGIAIMRPYHADRMHFDSNLRPVLYRIDYSEGGEYGYDKHMIVSIGGLPLADPLTDRFSLRTLKMFVGKTGDVIDVYGNSNHPNAKFFDSDTGFNWAFVASGNAAQNIAVAEVGLPPSNLDTDSREVILKEYSIKNVFTNQILTVWPNIDQTLLEIYLTNTNPPAYFSSEGFLSGGVSPGADWDVLASRIEDLTPYNPKEISNLTIAFK